MTTDIKAVLAAKNAASAATQEQTQEPVKEQVQNQEHDFAAQDNRRVFYGELPTSISLMTEKGIPVPFYQGFHVTSDPDVIAFCEAQKDIKDVTGKIDIDKVPEAPTRSRNRNWASASKFGDPTVFSPADLLQRAVASSNTLTTAARSDSSN